MSKIIKPCPFCGGKATIKTRKTRQGFGVVGSYRIIGRVACESCGAALGQYYSCEDEDGISRVITMWNLRTPVDSSKQGCEYCNKTTGPDGERIAGFDGQIMMSTHHGWQKIRYCPNCGRKIL